MSFKSNCWLRRVQAEPKTLVGLGAVAGLLLVLAKIVEDVVQKESGAFDRTILLAFRVPEHVAKPIGPAWLTSALLDVTSLGSPAIITLITIIAVAYLWVDGRNRLAILVAISIASGAIAEKIMKLGFDRARPEIVPHLAAVNSQSFPSGHAMLSAITYLTLGALLARAQSRWQIKVFILLTGVSITLLIGISRVYLGVHWPTDVLAGWVIGSIWAVVSWLVADRVAATPTPSEHEL
jgi:undecaprenyl-diphosphatase